MKNRVFIIGGGNSLKDFNFDLLKDEDTIAVNGAFYSVQNPTHIIWSDIDFWPRHKEHLEKDYKEAQLWASDSVWVLPPYRGVNPYIRRDTFQKGRQDQETKLNLYGGKGTYLTGVIALSFAIGKGYDHIYILGYDCKNIDGKNHFHDHSRPKDAFTHSMRLYDELKDENIINLGPDSDLKTFEFGNINEVLNENRKSLSCNNTK